MTRVVEEFGRIDVLINNAGGTTPSPTPEAVPQLVQQLQGSPVAENDFRRSAMFHAYAVQMNLISPWWFSLRVYQQMMGRQGRGSIVNISSGAGHPAGSPTLVSYGAANSGLIT